MKRITWDGYFIELASVAAKRATCPRKAVGAVIVKNKTAISTGYNGSISGFPHCEDVGCEIENNHCIRTIHAEVNAILQAAKNGAPIDGCTLYVTAKPCYNCSKLAVGAGIKRIVYKEDYGSAKDRDWGIVIEKYVES